MKISFNSGIFFFYPPDNKLDLQPYNVLKTLQFYAVRYVHRFLYQITRLLNCETFTTTTTPTRIRIAKIKPLPTQSIAKI